MTSYYTELDRWITGKATFVPQPYAFGVPDTFIAPCAVCGDPSCYAHGDPIILPGTCPFCLRHHGPRMCQPLRAAMGDDGVDVPSLIESLDDARDALELLVF